MLLLTPTFGCNLACRYCYNQNLLQANRYPRELNLAKMKETALRVRRPGEAVVLHGGEPLTLPLNLLEELLRFSFELCGSSSLQTNGTLVKPAHIDLFLKYNTSVGLSIDGPGELNRFRANIDVTERVLENLLLMKSAGVKVGIICVVSKANSQDPKRLADWILELDRRGIKGRINPCAHPSEEIQEDPERLADFYLFFAETLAKEGVKGWSPFADVVMALQGVVSVCTFSGCWPYSTDHGRMVLPDGSLAACLKFDRYPLAWTGRRESFRLEMLRSNDCQGCQFFEFCKGGCPGTALQFDWRNKDRFCPVWKALFRFYSKILAHLDLKVCADFKCTGR